jgi:hypothetical protein
MRDVNLRLLAGVGEGRSIAALVRSLPSFKAFGEQRVRSQNPGARSQKAAGSEQLEEIERRRICVDLVNPCPVWREESVHALV